MKLNLQKLIWTILLMGLLIPNLPAQTNYLGRTFTKLRAGQPLTIAWFGGSITWGVGASNPETTSYRGLTTQWFENTYPNSKITSINASIGGTGSQFGAYRCQHDVLSTTPDLVFIEFSVNDDALANSNFDMARQIEGIVRQIYTANPQSEIVFVYTVDQGMASYYSAGQTPPTVASYQAFETPYSIASSNVGYALWQAIQNGQGTWSSLTVDGTHPSDAGYQIYANTLISMLTSHENDTALTPMSSFPSGLSTNPITAGQEVLATLQPVPMGWSIGSVSTFFTFPNVVYSNVVGTTYTYTFKGTDIGLLTQWATDGGNMSYSLDGSSFQHLWAMTDGPDTNPRPVTISIGDNLTNTTHTLVLRIDAAGGSATGTSAYLGALLAFNPTGSVDSNGTLAEASFYNDTANTITYSGAWAYSSGRDFNDLDGDAHICASAGASATFSFAGTGVSFIAETASNNGLVNISIDGTPVTQVSCVSSGANVGQQYVYTNTSLSNSTHTLTVTNADGNWMLVDGFIAYSIPGSGASHNFTTYTGQTTINDTDPGITYQASQWGYSSGRGFGDYDDDVHFCGSAGTYASYTFTGTGIAVVTEKNSDEGHMSIQIDGGTATQVQCYNASRLAQQTVYSNTSLSNGTHTITITQVDGNFMLLDAFIVYQLHTAFDQWAASYGVSGTTSTPQHDNVPNLLKYLYNIDPSVPMGATDYAALPVEGLDTTTTPGTTYLTLTYRQNASENGITINVQTSSDLKTWTTVSSPAIHQQIGTDGNTGDPIMKVGVTATGSKQFIRLNVTVP